MIVFDSSLKSELDAVLVLWRFLQDIFCGLTLGGIRSLNGETLN